MTTYRLPVGYDHKEIPAVHFARERSPGAGMTMEKQGKRWCIRCGADKPQKGGRIVAGGFFLCSEHGRVTA